jgi:hypothetical protein
MAGTLYARVDYNLTLWQLQRRLQHIYHGQPCIPESTLSPSQGLWIWPLDSMQPFPRIVAIHQAEKARTQSFVKLLLERILSGKNKSMKCFVLT